MSIFTGTCNSDTNFLHDNVLCCNSIEKYPYFFYVFNFISLHEAYFFLHKIKGTKTAVESFLFMGVNLLGYSQHFFLVRGDVISFGASSI